MRIASSDDRRRLYVSITPPGRYAAAISVEDSTERGGLETMTCPHHGVITGATESTGIVYCLINGIWKNVAVSD
jgi:hypothetical protein